MTLSQILQETLTTNGWSMKDLSRRSGVSIAYLGKLKAGDMTNPSANVLEKLANGIGIDVAELTARLKDQTYSKTKQEGFEAIGFSAIPLFSDQMSSRGELDPSKAEGVAPVPDLWLKSGKNYFAIRAKGDSMEEKSISHGDILIFEERNTLQNGDIGLFSWQGETYCKFYQRVSSRYVILESANIIYSPILVDLAETSNFRILGKLAYQISKR